MNNKQIYTYNDIADILESEGAESEIFKWINPDQIEPRNDILYILIKNAWYSSSELFKYLGDLFRIEIKRDKK
jgi:hypothetical protein